MSARRSGMTLVELSYAWLAGCAGVDSILVGPASIEHLDAAIDAVTKPVSAEARRNMYRIDKDLVGTVASYAR